MNPSPLKIIPLGVFVLLPSLEASPVLPGKKIGVDFGPTLTANWNNFTANGSKAPGSVIHLDGTVSDNLEMIVADGEFFNNDGTNNWVGLQSNVTDISPNPKAPPEFVDSVTTDIAGNFSLGDGTPFKLTVTGLNPWLSFKVDAVSVATGSRIDTLSINGLSTYGPSAITRTNAAASGLYHHFAEVVADATGQLVFGVVDTSAGSNPILNGVLLEATGPTAAGLADNDGDTMPNWWEAAYQLDPASNADGGSNDVDGDGFSNAAEFAASSDPRNPLSTPALPSAWTTDGDGSWGTSANWNPATVPSGVNKTAILPSTALASVNSATVALNAPVTLGALEVTGTKGFSIGAQHPFTLSATGVDAMLKVEGSNPDGLTFLGNVVVASPLTAQIGGQSSIAINGNLGESGGANRITKTGAGNLVLFGDASGFTGDIDVQAGSLVLAREGDFTFQNYVLGGGSLTHSGGGKLTLINANDHSGGTFVIGSSLELDNGLSLGFGALTLDGSTLRIMADVNAVNRSLHVGSNGATVDVTAESMVLTTGSSAASSGTLLKTGPGQWVIQGGAAGTVGTFTLEQGSVDLAGNDRFGNHTGSQQDLVIGQGTRVTNGTGSTGFNAFRQVTLSGGSLVVTNSLTAVSGAFQAYHIKNGLIVEGSQPSFITDEVNGLNGAVNIGGTDDVGEGFGSDLIANVADVTGSTAADLTISAKLKNSSSAAFATLRTGILKEGAGTMVLSGADSYTGHTTVSAGSLVLKQASLADNANVSVATGASLVLDFAGTDTIDQLDLGGVGMPVGIYGAVGSPSPVISTPLITGSGTLTVTTAPTADPFADWMATNYPSILTPDNEPDADPDGDGLSNIQEFAFAGNPGNGASSALIRHGIENIGGTDYLTVTFACRTGAAFSGTGPMTAAKDGATYQVAASHDLSGFTQPIVEVTPAIPGSLPASAPAGFEYRSFRLSVAKSANAKAFLKVTADAVQ